MSSATPFRFSDASELLVQSGHIPQHLYTGQLGGRSESPGEGRSISAGESTVTSLKTENWTNTSTDRQTLETFRLRLSGQEASHSSIDRLALLASVASESVFSSGSSAPSFTTNMSTYISGSNGQAEALQTLHLMNTNYTGYGDSSSSGNMVLFSPGTGAVGQGSPLGSSDHQHQQPHFARYGLSPGVTQTSYSHPSHIAAMSNTELAHQSTATDFYSKRTSSQGYNWAGGNEFSFLSPGHVAESDQRISSHMNLVKAGQLTASDMSHFGVGSLNGSAYHEQAPLFTNSIAAHGVNMDNLHAPSGAGHILSLSLSPQQPSMIQQLHSFPIQHNEPAANFFHGLSNAGSDNVSKEAVFSNKCAGDNVGGSFTVPSCDNMSGMGFQHPNTGEHRHVDILANQLTVGSYGSRYLKPAQELLNEVVSVGRGLRVNVLKRAKPQSWTGPSSASDGTFIKSMNVVDAPSRSIISWSGGKEGEPIVTAMPINIAGISEQTMEAVVELSSADRQELQAKRAKLVGMRDEVDRRYKQYYHQMQVVATSFESAAGLGAAAAYTALALQTISKHFRCLRDAISGQIQVTCKALGEDEVSGLARGETSKLRFIDQQLRQQHALRQLGMMQQQAWRPQRGLPEHSVSILRAWLFEHFLHPYPKDADKIMLAKQTGLHRNQVSNWFINARVRLWKPMVEEMYLEETKEGDTDRADKSGGNEGDPGEEEMVGVSDGGPNSEFSKPFKQAKLSDEDRQAFGDLKGSSSYSSDMLQGRILVSSPSDNLLFHEKDGMRQGVMKLRHASQDASSLLSGTGINYKSNKANGEVALESENKIRSDDSYKEQYNVTQNGFVQAEHLNLAGYASSYQINGLNRYGQESFGTSYAANGGVSLTLGLQHCEGLSFSGGQQHYNQGGTAHLMTSRREDDGVGSADYYNVNENSYEVLGLQSRKPFPAHMLCHDFVV